MKKHAEKGDAVKNTFLRAILLVRARFWTPRGRPLAKKGEIVKVGNRQKCVLGPFDLLGENRAGA